MTDPVRDQILNKLKKAPGCSVDKQPEVKPPAEEVMGKDDLVETFCRKFTGHTGIVHRLSPGKDFKALLGEIFSVHNICRAIAGNDQVLERTGFCDAVKNWGPELCSMKDFSTRADFTREVFDNVDAGITGADYAIAESGTLLLAFDSRNARLISLAPPVHIALIPEDKIVGSYEQAMAGLQARGAVCSQIVFITGPSMTADIQGRPFKGMHGPGKLIAVIV